MITMLTGKSSNWTARDLADHFGVSTRTIYRDREFMEKMGVPIYYNYDKESYEIKDTFHFTPPNLTAEEARALMLAAREHENNFIYPRQLKEAISKVISSLPQSFKKEMNDTDEMITYLDSPHIDFSLHRDKIKSVDQAIDKRRIIKIVYFSLSQQKITHRKVEPYNIFVNNGAAYMVGYCHKREEIRTFRVDRIKAIKEYRDNFTIPEEFSLEDYLDTAFNVERGEKREVVLRFKGVASYLVREIHWHDSQEIEEINDDEIIFKLNTGSSEELKSWILSYGSEVEVLKPDELRQEVIEELEKMRKVYK